MKNTCDEVMLAFAPFSNVQNASQVKVHFIGWR